MSERRDAIEAAVVANDVRALRNLYQDWITEEQDKQEDRVTRARLDERRAIVGYLRLMAEQTSVGYLPIRLVAARIERGEHVS